MTGIFNVAAACGVPDGVRAICKSVRWIYELISMAKFVGLTDRSKCDLYICTIGQKTNTIHFTTSACSEELLQ